MHSMADGDEEQQPLQPDTTVRIILLGNSNAGKTSLVSKFVYGELPEFAISTVGVDFETKTVSYPFPAPRNARDGSGLPTTEATRGGGGGGSSSGESQKKIVKLMVWDTAGQERYKSVTTSYYRSDGCVVLYDLTDPDGFQHVKYWLDELAEYAPPSISVLVVGNKQDVHPSLANTADIEIMTACQGIPSLQTSISQVESVDFIFEKLLGMILAKQLLQPASSSRPVPSRSGSANSLVRRGSYESQILAAGSQQSLLSSSPTGRRSPLSPIMNLFRRSSTTSSESTVDAARSPSSPVSWSVHGSPTSITSVASSSSSSSSSTASSHGFALASVTAGLPLASPSPKKPVSRRPFQLKEQPLLVERPKRQCCAIS